MVSALPASTGGSSSTDQRFRVAVVYTIDGDLRYISHHDELRMLTRALLRASWPLRFSQGFNPLPRIVLPLPRSVGMASECQWALVALQEGRAARELRDSLAAALPPTVRLRRLMAPAAPGKPHPLSAAYTLALDPAQARRVAPRVRRLMAQEHQAARGDIPPAEPRRTPDSRAYLETLVLDGLVLRMHLRYQMQRSARPSEILTELGLDAEAHRVRRTEVVWDMELTGTGAEPTAPEGIRLGKEESNQHQEENQDHQTDPKERQ